MKISSLPFYKGLIICIVLSIIQVLIIQKSIIVYIPLLFSILFSFYYGIVSPKKGWILAGIQVLIIIASYWTLTSMGYVATKPQEAQFVSHIIIFPSFVASFLAAFLFGNRTKD
jgi:hypothetical protein